MPGSGKSTFWKIISEGLNMSFFDFDEHIEVIYQKSVWELLEELWEKEFLCVESQLALKLQFENTIFATSWSLPYSELAMNHLSKLWTIIYLKVDIWEIIDRLKNMKTERIIGFKGNTFKEIFQEREWLYQKYADIIFNYSWNNIDKLSLELIHTLCPTP